MMQRAFMTWLVFMALSITPRYLLVQNQISSCVVRIM